MSAHKVIVLVTILFVKFVSGDDGVKCLHSADGQLIFELPTKYAKEKKILYTRIITKKFECKWYLDLGGEKFNDIKYIYYSKGLKLANNQFAGNQIIPEKKAKPEMLKVNAEYCLELVYINDKFPFSVGSKCETFLFKIPEKNNSSLGRHLAENKASEWHNEK